MIKNIIFDWSGTLSNDFTPCCKAILSVLEHFKAKKITEEELRNDFELPFTNFYKRHIPNFNLEEGKKVFDATIAKIKGPTVYEGVKKTIHYLASRKINMIVLSAHPQHLLESEAKKYGIYDFFKELNGSVIDKKKIIHELLERNRFNPDQTAYLGDMRHDIDTGNHAGLITIGITWGYQSKDMLKKSNPNHIINNINDLEKIIF